MGTVWTRLNAALLTLILLALVPVLGTLALRAEGGPLDPPGSPGSTDGVREAGTPLTGPTVITAPGRYYLTRDIQTAGNQSGIEIAASRVTLDLNGFSIVGTDTAGSFGILVSGSRLDIDIRHGRILDFQTGLYTGPGFRVLIDDIHVAGSGRGIELGQSSILRNCSSTFNSETGVYAPGAEVLIQNCMVRDNGLGGVTLSGGYSTLERSFLTDNGAEKDVISRGFDNLIRENRIGSFDVRNGVTAIMLDNVVDQITITSGVIFTGADHANVNY